MKARWNGLQDAIRKGDPALQNAFQETLKRNVVVGAGPGGDEATKRRDAKSDMATNIAEMVRLLSTGIKINEGQVAAMSQKKTEENGPQQGGTTNAVSRFTNKVADFLGVPGP